MNIIYKFTTTTQHKPLIRIITLKIYTIHLFTRLHNMILTSAMYQLRINVNIFQCSFCTKVSSILVDMSPSLCSFQSMNILPESSFYSSSGVSSISVLPAWLALIEIPSGERMVPADINVVLHQRFFDRESH